MREQVNLEETDADYLITPSIIFMRDVDGSVSTIDLRDRPDLVIHNPQEIGAYLWKTSFWLSFFTNFLRVGAFLLAILGCGDCLMALVAYGVSRWKKLSIPFLMWMRSFAVAMTPGLVFVSIFSIFANDSAYFNVVMLLALAITVGYTLFAVRSLIESRGLHG